MLYYYVIESVISSSNFIDSRTYASLILVLHYATKTII